MLKNIIEAMIFGAGKGFSYSEIKANLGDTYTEKEMKTAINQIKEKYSEDSGIVLIEFDGKYQFQTNPKYGELLGTCLRPIKEKELTNTLLQTLSIIAYRQPITRLAIEEVRGGVSCDYAISVLMKLGLIDIVGRGETVGRPALFGTTDAFLKRFQLHSLQELPSYEEILKAAKSSDRYYKDTSDLYRSDEIIEGDEYKGDVEEFFDEMNDEIPNFLKDEDIIVVD